MAVWSKIPIEECGEGLARIPFGRVAMFDPHPYVEQGAVYTNGLSPFMMRASAVQALLRAQDLLQTIHPGHRLKVFDALRPVDVQRQMIDLTVRQYAMRDGLDPDVLTLFDHKRLHDEVAESWANPTMDPTTPPPHSTGGAIDLTMVDAQGREIDMGTVIDQCDGPCATNAFNEAADMHGRAVHKNRQLLVAVMEKAGFRHNPNEWWHFDFGNQRWAYETRRCGGDPATAARYGRTDLVQALKVA